MVAGMIPKPKDGVDGQNGKDGKNGTDGRGIAGVAVDDDNNVIIVYTDKSYESAGTIKPKFNVGDLTDVDIENLQKRFDPIYPQWIDENGKVVDMIPSGVRLGETMPMRVKFILEQLKRANGSNSN
jgi:hypothetical protein